MMRHNPEIVTLDAFDMIERELRHDATPGGGMWFQREIESVSARVLEEERPSMKAFEFFPISTEVPVDVDVQIDQIMEWMGEAEFVGNYSDDPPTVDMAIREGSSKAHDLWMGATWNVRELAKARARGRGLPSDKSRAAVEAIERKLDRLTLFGEPARGVYGIATHPFVPRLALPNAISTATAAATMLADLHAAANTIADNTEDEHQAMRIISPRRTKDVVRQMKRGTGTDETVLRAFMEDTDVQTWETWEKLKGIGPNGEDGMWIDTGRDPLVCTHRISQRPTPQPAERHRLTTEVLYLARTLGVFIPRPLQCLLVLVPRT